jgi:LysM repeat protein
MIVLLAMVSAGCNFSPAPPATATASPQPPTSTTAATALALMPTETLPPQATTNVEPVLLESPTLTATATELSVTLTPSATPGPFQYTIKANDSLIAIIQQYGYQDFSTSPGSIIDQIVRLNGLANADSLPGPGTVLLIPPPTPTATPANTETAVANVATNAAANPAVTPPSNTFQYIVQSGDTIVGIAQDNSTTLEVIASLNQDLNFFGCNFNIPSGGPKCNVPLQVGQAINLPAPTPTPTLSPTPSGSETPTATPTYEAPMLSYPPPGAVAEPGVFSLQWVSVGVLSADEYYLVQVTDTTANTGKNFITKSTSMLLPDSLIPADGKAHTFNWTVYVVVYNTQTQAYRPIGGQPEIRSFQWKSR